MSKDTSITYLTGDATVPRVAGPKVIAHVCNDIGKWGKGFVLAVSKRWKEPESQYREWHQNQNDFLLGSIQIVQVADELWVANMIGQRGIKTASNGAPPIRYDALEQCLAKLAESAKIRNASVHMPRIGCGLAGGKWELVEPLIVKCLCANDVSVHVYDFA